VLAATAATAVLTMAGPAMADVRVDPTSAPQGSGQNLYFTVTNPGRSPITQVKLVLPPDNPIAEVYPLSVDDWAPRITHITLSTPLPSIHNGAPLTDTAGAITWIAVPGKALAPGKSTELGVALGPLPTTSSITFSLQPAYADGKPGPALPPATLSLTPAVPGQATGHEGHGGTATVPDDADAATFAALAAQADDGQSFWTIAGWVLAGLALAGAALLLLRGRKASPPAEEAGEVEDEHDQPKEPVAAGAPRVTSWSYRDRPE
jgi:hypothetical protein